MRIGVVGMGAAGCRAAMLLRERGHTPVLFEARPRVGGRLQTVEAENGFYEAGGEWIDRDNTRIIALLRQFKQEPHPTQSWPGWVWYGGERSDERTLWPDVLEDAARIDETADLMASDLEEVPWDNVTEFATDQKSLSKFLDEQCRSRRGRWWQEATQRSDEGDDTDQISLLGWLCGRMNYDGRDEGDMSAFRFPQGAQRFCEKMVEGLSIRHGAILERVEREAGEVNLYFQDHRESFDHVILTLPPPALRRIVFDPGLSEDKEAAIAECRMSRTVKISLLFRNAFWEALGWPGRGMSDGPIQQFWNASRGECAVINLYIGGADALRWLEHGDPIHDACRELDHLLPGALESLSGGDVYNWIDDPYAGGSFSHLAPGYALGPMQAFSRPESGLHFAGEHTSLWTGYIEGALESAERVVKEILE